MSILRFKRAKKESGFDIDWSLFLKKAAKNIINLAIPVVMGLVCYYVFLHIGLYFETNDDPAALFMLSAEGQNFTMIFSKPLSTLISSLISAYPTIPVWTFVTLITITVSLIICLFVLRLRLRPILFWPISIFVILFFTATTVVQINFTRTAAAAAVAGVMLILQGIITFEKKGASAKVCSIIEVLFGVAVWFWGAMIRDLIAYLILPFAGLFILFYALTRTDKLSIKQFFINIRIPIIISAAALIAAVIATVVSYNMFTAEERDAIEHYKARGAVQDYTENYPTYEEAEDEYRSLGITENEYYMIFVGWTTEDTNFFTTELYTEMRENLYTENSLFEGIDMAVDYLRGKGDMFLFAALFILAILIHAKGMKKLYLPVFLFCAFAYIVFLAIQGRILPRAVDPVFLYIILIATMLIGENNQGEGTKRLNRIEAVASFLMVLILAVFTFPIFSSIFKGFNENIKKAEDEYFGQEYPQVATLFYDYLEKNSDTAYLLTISDGITFMPSTNIPIFIPTDAKTAENLFFLGGWDVRSPATYDRLLKYDIDNPLEALIENQNTLTVYSLRLHDYLIDHYGADISVSMIETAELSNGIRLDFVKFTRPLSEIIEPIDEENAQINEVDISQFFYAELPEGYVNVPTSDTLNIKGMLNEEQLLRYQELYLNIETKDGRTSYGIFIEPDGSFECYAFGPDIDILNESIEISLVARDISGELIVTNILTEFFMQ